ncbi:MAG: PaaI family thioesterase [Acidimicrobiia bacterium]|nr:PaaI family thioesterase [Acidimicrobiia bacterium]
MSDIDSRAAAVRARYNDCFGCGLNNPIGLHLDGFAREGDELAATFIPRPGFQGFAGILHGGILAALLDETLAWTAMMLEGQYVVTASLELKFRKPAPASSTYEVRGRVDDRRGRRMKLSGSAAVNSGVIAEATGLFVATESVDGTRV